jgi:TRAP-type C4-dicarboxylate transport system permease small subunit
MGIFNFLEKRLEEVIAGFGVVLMALMVFFQVVMRYVFSTPVSWSDEIAQYCMLWSVYLSVSWAVRERAHIRVMNFVNLFSEHVRKSLTMFSDFMWFVFGVFLTWHSITLNISYWENTYASPALNIDQKWPYLCLVFGFGLMTLRIIQVYYRWWFYGDSILEDTSKGDAPHA